MISIKGISYRSLPHHLEGMAGLSTIADQLVEQRLWAKSLVPHQSHEWLDRHICSTITRVPFNIDASLLSNFLKRVQTDAQLTFINEYECASWGFSLAWQCRLFPRAKYVVLSIVDHGLLGLPEFNSNPAYGRSCSGTCVVILDVSQFEPTDIETGLIASGSPAASLLTRLKIKSRQQQLGIVLPFFPDDLWQNLKLAAKDMTLLPNWHDLYGHCFGADPWLAIALDDQKTFSSYLASSLALNGYKSIVKVRADDPFASEVLV